MYVEMTSGIPYGAALCDVVEINISHEVMTLGRDEIIRVSGKRHHDAKCRCRLGM